MSLKQRTFRLAAAAAVLSMSLNIQMVHAADSQGAAEQEVIVVYKNEEGKERVQEESVDIDHQFKSIPAIAATVTGSDLKEWVRDPNIAYIERNITFRIADDEEAGESAGNSFQGAVSGTAAAEQSQWSFQALGPAAMWNAGYTGTNVKVAVLDSGIYAHSELNIAGGISTVDYTGSYSDDNGHGTHVAGIIAAKNNGAGMVGVAPNVQLYAVKALDYNGEGTLADILEGLEWAISSKMDIINLSLGTDTDSELLKDMVDRAYNAGILVVAAAGNSQNGKPLTTDTVNYPARYDSAIAVAAIDSANHRGSFSSVGNKVELAAPGVNIISAYVSNGTPGYAMMSGTSQAAPHISGMLALLKQKYPQMTNVQLREEIRRYAVDLGTPGRDAEYGYGEPTFNKDITAPSEVSGLQVTGKTDQTLSLAWMNPADPDFASSSIYVNNVKTSQTAEQAYTIQQLQPGTAYNVTVKTVDTAGNESAGATVTAATYSADPLPDHTPPAEVTGLKAELTAAGSIQLSWTNPADPDFAKAVVYVNDSVKAETGDPGITLGGLASDTVYSIKVRTADTAGNLSDGVSLEARTAAAEPAPAAVNPAPAEQVPAAPSAGGGGGIVTLPPNLTPSPSGETAAVPEPAAEDSGASAAGTAIAKARKSLAVSDYVQARLSVFELAGSAEYSKYAGELNELKSALGFRELPARTGIRSGADIGISLQTAMNSESYRLIDGSTVKPGENLFVLDGTGRPVSGLNIRVAFNRIVISPGTGGLLEDGDYTVLIGTTVKGREETSAAAQALTGPLLLPFSIGDENVQSVQGTGEASFTDVKQGAWYEDNIRWALSNGMIKGYADGSFKPGKTVTEAEFLAMLLRAFEPQLASAQTAKWSDVYYSRAKELNYPAAGYGNNAARGKPLQRTRVAELIAAADGVSLSGEGAIRYLLAFGLAEGKDPKQAGVKGFDGSALLTRAEALQFIKNLKEIGAGGLLARPSAADNAGDLPVF